MDDMSFQHRSLEIPLLKYWPWSQGCPSGGLRVRFGRNQRERKTACLFRYSSHPAVWTRQLESVKKFEGALD